MNGRRYYLLLPALAVAFCTAVSGDGAADERAQGTRQLSKADVEAMMKSLSNWGRWGPEDQLGTLNLITPEKRKQAAALVKEGVPVSMARTAIKEPLDD